MPLKYLSTEFHGPGSWAPTGCFAAGVGVPMRRAQHSTDGLYTIDLKLEWLDVNGQQLGIADQRYIRLEVLPGRPAHGSVRRRRPSANDFVWFRGPLVWDNDRDCPNFCGGHMEVHPIELVIFLSK